MNPRLRQILVTCGCALLAVWLGWLIADGAYGLPALAAVVGLAAALVRVTRLPADVILLGLLLVGYIVGNRGFAQLIVPVMGFPLLPAELGLAIGCGWLVVQSALSQTLPLRRNSLNWILLLWIMLGTVRVLFDVPRFGFLAVRDYAMIYYAAFFFLAQSYAADPRARRYLTSCIGLAVCALLPIYFFSSAYPAFFLTNLTVRGVPLVFLKGDLALTFLAVGAVTIFFAPPAKHPPWAWVFSVAMFLTVWGGDNRASVVGGVVAIAWLVFTRRWTFPALQGAAGLLAFVLLLGAAYIGQVKSAEDKLGSIYDRTVSIVDVSGDPVYESESEFKGDNNRFRLIWWRTVAEEVWQQGPVFGLGFGYDLAKGFVQIYNPEMGEEFLARSPHSIVVTMFGRMGATGLGLVLALVGAMAVKTWRSLRDQTADPVVVGLWCATWIIFTSACFGVVLEGPMGAVVFWTLLGLANGAGAGGIAAPPKESSAWVQGPKEHGVMEPATGLPEPAGR